MPTASEADAAAPSPRRRPEQLLLAFLGDLVVDRDRGPLPAAVLVGVLAELGVGEPATRAALGRMTSRGLLDRVRRGRTVAYALTPTSEKVLRDARGRVFADDPFAPDGAGWTLVTFSVPESMRDLRHRVRAQLTWSGFGLLRDGLWIAPGEVDLSEVLGEFADGRADLAAFRAVEVEGFSAARTVREAWRLDEIRARHLAFQAGWAQAGPDGARPLRDVVALVADWLALLRAVPRLPAEHLDEAWPAPRSVEVFARRHAELAAPARVELDRRLGR